MGNCPTPEPIKGTFSWLAAESWESLGSCDALLGQSQTRMDCRQELHQTITQPPVVKPRMLSVLPSDDVPSVFFFSFLFLCDLSHFLETDSLYPEQTIQSSKIRTCIWEFWT